MKNKGLKSAALTVATFASFLTPFMGSALNIALPAIADEFHADAIDLNWIASIYLLSTAVFLFPSGRMADIVGRKKIFSIGIVLFMIGSALAALSRGVPFLLFTRALQGVGSALIFGTGVAILSSVFPPGERGRALGINISAVYLGLSTGPFVGGILTQYLGWRSIFWIILPFGAGALLLLALKLKAEWAEAKGEKFDWTGFVLFGLSLVLWMYGFSLVPEAKGFLLILSGLGVFLLFVRVERKLSSPLLEIRLFVRNRTFAFSNLAALIHYSATYGVSFLLSLYLQHIKNLSPREAGFVLLAQPVIMAFLSPFSGKWSDRFEPRILASTGMALSCVGLLLLSLTGANTSLPYLVIILVLLGTGYALFSSPNTNAIMSSVEKRQYGLASGSVGTMRMLGQMFSMGITLMIFSVLIGRVEISPENHPAFVLSMNISFGIFALLCFLGIFASLARGRMHGQQSV